ncbi:hypothetical protein [Rhodococcoides fascians]|uniref:hypothetical protein n=1 Tax=Rhodococcoides fascians TaxID=1828 RepID=UPI0005663E94|nr:hypothetical protein [Rhodococcus fascians]
MSTDSDRELLDAVEHAIENELDSYTVDSRANLGNGYIAEVITSRLSRDGFLREPQRASMNTEGP